MTIATITALPTVPATNDSGFEAAANALFTAIKDVMIGEINTMIGQINVYDFGLNMNIGNIVGLTAGYIPYGAGSGALANSSEFNYDSANTRLNAPVIRASTGVLFGTDTAAANTLDDYEEGVWTPVLSDGTNNATTSNAEGKYTKIGDVCTITCYIETSSLGSVSGNLRITGLPFAPTGYNGVTAPFASGLAITAGTSVGVYCEYGASVLYLYNWDATTGISNLQHSEWTDDGQIRFSMLYKVA